MHTIESDVKGLLDITIWGIDLSSPLHLLLKAVLLYLVSLAIIEFIKFLFRKSEKRSGKVAFEQTNLLFFKRMLIYVVYILAGSAFLSMIPGLETIGSSILAGAGIFTMAIGLAAQGALSNIISGMFIVFGKPFRIGDAVLITDLVSGIVTDITLRHTVIRSADNKMIVVPNSIMNSSTIINSTIGEQATCSFVEIGVSYNANLDQAMAIMQQEATKHHFCIDRRKPEEVRNGDPQIVVRVMTLGESAITLRAWVWASNSGEAFVLKCELLKILKERFDKEGIEIPYPHRTVILQK